MSTNDDTEARTVIRSRTGAILHTSQKATVREALEEAVEARADLGSANLRSANLRYANLRSANLGYANLRSANLGYANLRYANLGSANLGSANLGSANLRYANLRSANLRSANLGYANLGSANLGSANLRYANLGYANLGSANLGSANLRSANLGYANLRYANLVDTTCLSVTGLPSGHAILAPLPDGWRLTIGCWNGTVTELRELIARDDGWPEAHADQIVARRPMLAALADMCDAWTATNADVLQQVQDKWAPKVEVTA